MPFTIYTNKWRICFAEFSRRWTSGCERFTNKNCENFTENLPRQRKMSWRCPFRGATFLTNALIKIRWGLIIPTSLLANWLWSGRWMEMDCLSFFCNGFWFAGRSKSQLTWTRKNKSQRTDLGDGSKIAKTRQKSTVQTHDLQVSVQDAPQVGSHGDIMVKVRHGWSLCCVVVKNGGSGCEGIFRWPGSKEKPPDCQFQVR